LAIPPFQYSGNRSSHMELTNDEITNHFNYDYLTVNFIEDKWFRVLHIST